MNTYSLNARIYPVILSILPVVVIGVLFSLQFKDYYQTLGGLGISAVLFYLFSQIGRDRGKKLEQDLWNNWGGAPTTQLFRFSNDKIDQITKNRYHAIMNSKVNAQLIPTEQLEAQAPDKCDEVYRAWTKFQIGETRDTKKYNLLFAENISYGFRRNMLGLKPFALLVLGFMIVSVILVNYFYFEGLRFDDLNTIIALSILFFSLLFWLFVVRTSWLRIPAVAYAERLLETIN